MPTSNRRPGDINRNGQRLLAKTTAPGTDHLQKIWNVECAHPASGDARQRGATSLKVAGQPGPQFANAARHSSRADVRIWSA